MFGGSHHTGAARPLLDHHYEEHSAFIPTADPAHTPTINAITEGRGFEQAQELGFNFHGTQKCCSDRLEVQRGGAADEEMAKAVIIAFSTAAEDPVR